MTHHENISASQADHVGPPRLAGTVALVTGATGGIGAATARRLAAEGAQLVLTGRSANRGEALRRELGASTTFLAADLTRKGSVDEVVGCTLQRHGRLDTLINNAAVDHTRRLLETPVDEARDVFALNLFAALEMLQAAARVMTDNGGGSIVNVTSRLATIGVPTMAVYGASKGALLALTKGAAVELAPSGIRVNTVAPGLTRTPLYEAWIGRQSSRERIAREAVATVPQRRLAEPEDVAAAIAYLASPDAAHVTGASLPVDGGYTAA